MRVRALVPDLVLATTALVGSLHWWVPTTGWWVVRCELRWTALAGPQLI